MENTHTHTHTHNDCSRNWVLILVGADILWEEECLALKDDRVEQCLRFCGSEFQMWGPKQEKVQKPWVLCLYCWIFSMWVSEEEHSAQDGVQTCNSLLFREVSRTRTIYITETHKNYFIFNTFWNGKPVQFFQEGCWVVVAGCQENESCSNILNFLERLDDRIRCTHEETVAVVKPWEDIIESNKESWLHLQWETCRLN